MVKSNAGAGTTFTFFIPYQKIEKSLPAKTDADDPFIVLKGKSILAVDDNELNLLLLKKLTDKWNVIFHQASNGKEALDIISKNSITVVLSDIAMPGMDGNELLAAVMKLEHPLPVIVVSGSADKTNAKTFLDKGFAGVIGKPFVEEDVIKQLIKVIH